MSFYNCLFGENRYSSWLLAALKLTEFEIPRYRDAYWDGEFIVIHTRTGGGNRDFYESAEIKNANYSDYREEYNGPWNEDLRKNPYYVKDSDDEFDNTYANFYFNVPDECIKNIKTLHPSPSSSEKWESFFKKLGM